MSTPVDELLGAIYIDPAYFLANAGVFGCAAAVAGMDEESVKPLLAAASRLIDSEAGREFAASSIYENHRFDIITRRVRPNRPPLQTLTSYRLRTAAGLVSSFDVTPVQTDGQNNVSFGAIYYNRQENYLELSSLAAVAGLTAQIVSLGLGEPQVEICYTSFADLPKQVIAATGYLAAHIINESAANNLLAPGLTSMKADDVEVTRRQSTSQASSSGDSVSPRVKDLLRSVSRIAIG